VWNSGFKTRCFFLAVTFIFVYTSFANMSERPEGLHIALFFIGCILFASILSRAMRATELRVEDVRIDWKGLSFIEEALHSHGGEVRLLAHKHGMRDFREKERHARLVHSIQPEEGDFIFLEVELSDASEFSEDLLEVTGHEEDGYKILRCSNPAIANAIAAVLLEVRERTRKIPHVYFSWTQGDPIAHLVRYIFLGEGETAPLTREILRRAEPYEDVRPVVHVA
jgi:hypothetical protein